MKKCPKCGRTHGDNSQFCENCSAYLGRTRLNLGVGSLIDAIADFLDNPFGRTTAAPGWASPSSLHAQENGEAYSKKFIASDETVQAAIGTNHLSGANFQYGAAILTDKRLYYFGRVFAAKGMNTNGFTELTEEGIVSVDEITFTRFIHRNPLGCLLTGIIALALGIFLFVGDHSFESLIFTAVTFTALIAGVIFLLCWLLTRSAILEISFPGGAYRIDSRWHSTLNMREFQSQIHLVKDRLKAQKAEGKEGTEALQ